MTLTLDKAKYASGEQVIQTLRVVNTTSSPITLKDGACAGFLKIVKFWDPPPEPYSYEESYVGWGGENECEDAQGQRPGVAPNVFEPGIAHTNMLLWDQRRDERCEVPNCSEATPPRGTLAPAGKYSAIAGLQGRVCNERENADEYPQPCDQPDRYAYRDGCPTKNENGLCVPRLEFEITSEGAPRTPTTGIKGSVVHGPVCASSETGCEGRPLKGVAVAIKYQDPVSEDGQDETSAIAGEGGEFKFDLPPGTYGVGVRTRSYPRCDSQTVEVVEGSYTTVTLTCDAGQP